MKIKYKRGIAGVVVLVMLLFTACGEEGTLKEAVSDVESPVLEEAYDENKEEGGSDVSDSDAYSGSQVKAEYSAKDLDASYDPDTAVHIEFTDDTVKVTDEVVSVVGNRVVIGSSGTYVLSGSSEEGQVIVDAPEDADVILVLDGLELSSSSTSPLRIQEADKVILTLAQDSMNSISDGVEYIQEESDSDDPNAAIYSKADLTINGSGSLFVNGNYRHGIVSKDDLKIVSGNITVKAVMDGIKGKDLLAVKDGEISIEAGGDAMQSDNEEDPLKGNILIEGGTFELSSGADGVQAETVLSITGGIFTITTGGGSENSSEKSTWGNWGSPMEEDATESASDSAKGLKAGENLNLSGGEIRVDSSDDAVHSNGDIMITGGVLEISSGDDALHADSTLTVEEGEIHIITCYEGLEGAQVIIRGGDISVGALDDGINTSGGNDGSSVNGRQGQNGFDTSDGSSLLISGGEIYIEAMGDGIDSNGDIEMSGGVVVVHGPVNSRDGAVDYNGSFTITSGMILAIGSSGMAQNVSTTSSQGAFLYNTTQVEAGSILRIEDAKGEEILSFTSQKTFSSILYSAPSLQEGESYQILKGVSEEEPAENGLYETGKVTGDELVGEVQMSSLQVNAGSSSEGVHPGFSQPGNGGMRPGGRP